MNFFRPHSRIYVRVLFLTAFLALSSGASAPLSALGWFHRQAKPAAKSAAGAVSFPASAPASASASAPVSAPAAVAPAAPAPDPGSTPASAAASVKPGAVAVAPAPRPTASQLTLEAQAAYQRGELTRAGKLFAKASALEPDNAATAYNAGIFFFQAREPAKAEKYFHRALKRNPDHALAHYYLGLIAEKAGNYDDAITEYSEAARRDRRVLDAAYNKEVVQSRLTMDVRLRRYLDGDRPLDFAAISAPGELTPKPEEKPKPKVEPKPAPRPEIRIDSNAPTPAAAGKRTNRAQGDGGRPGEHRRGNERGGAGSGPYAGGAGIYGQGSGGDHKPDSTDNTDPTSGTDDDYPPPPPVPPPERHEPDIDRP